jgi:NAD(P)-dependent dehydrogenase (short-subunit alcohol dehydrogenase family)
MTNTVLITGANRGIGLEFARQYAEDGWQVHACCRQPDTALDLRQALAGKDADIHQLDVTDQASIDALKVKLAEQAIDILINNAGIMGGDHQSFGDIDYDAWESTLRTNTIGPYRVFEALQHNLLLGTDKKVAFISSRMGSIEQFGSSDNFIYRSSKTALNMVVVNLDYEFKSTGICFLAFHPGWVQTDMGGESAPIKPPESANALRRSISNATQAQSGSFLNFDGSALPW